MNQHRASSGAILVAVIALVAALAGTAVAGPDASTSASVKKQVKKLKKRVKALEQQGQLPGPQGPPGERGLPGQPGEDATNLFAYIKDGPTVTASLVFGTGVTEVSDPDGNSDYFVTFNRSLENCVVHAIPGSGNPVGPGGGSVIAHAFPSVSRVGAGNTPEVTVTFTGPESGAPLRDTSFMISAFC